MADEIPSLNSIPIYNNIKNFGKFLKFGNIKNFDKFFKKRQPHISMQPSSRNPNLDLTDSHPRVRQDVDIN